MSRVDILTAWVLDKGEKDCTVCDFSFTVAFAAYRVWKIKSLKELNWLPKTILLEDYRKQSWNVGWHYLYSIWTLNWSTSSWLREQWSTHQVHDDPKKICLKKWKSQKIVGNMASIPATFLCTDLKKETGVIWFQCPWILRKKPIYHTSILFL